jgi:hypothetical protein
VSKLAVERDPIGCLSRSAPRSPLKHQAPSKRLAAGSSPARGAPAPPSFGRAFLLIRAGGAGPRRSPGRRRADQGRSPGPSGCHRAFAGSRVEHVSKFSAGRRSARSRRLRLWESALGLQSPFKVRKLPVDASGVDRQEHGDAVPGPLGHLGGRDAIVESLRKARVPVVLHVRAPWSEHGYIGNCTGRECPPQPHVERSVELLRDEAVGAPAVVPDCRRLRFRRAPDPPEAVIVRSLRGRVPDPSSPRLAADTSA